jgi:hypothetical protein
VTTAFPYPWDEPVRIEERRAVLVRSGAYVTGLGDTLASARRSALDGWSGVAADAAATALSARVAAAQTDADRLRSSAAALEAYTAVVVRARQEIDALRARQAAVDQSRADTDAALRAFVAIPSLDGVADFLRCLGRQAALRREAADLATRYREVMRRVADAATACGTALWQHGAGLAARARDLGEQAGTRYPVPPGVRRPGGSPESEGESYTGGLGPMIVGTTVPTPDVPPWPEPDPGAGEHGSEFPWPDDYLTHQAAWAASVALHAKWPHAADNLRHFLGNSGGAQEQDVDQMLADLPGLSDEVHETRAALGADALARARAAGVTQPVTFPVSTTWRGYYATQSESPDWFYASGGFSYSMQGEVTVYPPASPGGSWTYEQTTAVSTYDRYNWDGSKATEILGQTVTDEQLGELHRAGIAQEYDLYGTSASSSSTGS